MRQAAAAQGQPGLMRPRHPSLASVTLKSRVSGLTCAMQILRNQRAAGTIFDLFLRGPIVRGRGFVAILSILGLHFFILAVVRRLASQGQFLR